MEHFCVDNVIDLFRNTEIINFINSSGTFFILKQFHCLDKLNKININ